MPMNPQSSAIVVWIAAEILPHETIVRRWLSRHWGHALEVGDVMQEAYCRLADLPAVEHIGNPRAYFFATVRSVAIDALRAAKTANADRMTEIDWESVLDPRPSPDRVAEGHQELRRLQQAMAGLSGICREVIVLRRLHGLSQAETARRLGVSESVVENHVVRGLKSLLKALAEPATTHRAESVATWNGHRKTRQTSRPRSGRSAWRMER